MEQLIQIGADFIEAQGMMAFVVVVLAVLMWRDQSNRAVESKQQGETLKILGEEVANNRAMIVKMDVMKADLIDEARAISNASTQPILTSINTIAATNIQQSESVDTMNGKLEDLEKAVNLMLKKLDEVLLQLQQLKEESEAPTEPTAVIIDPGEPSIGKLKTVGKPYIGDGAVSTATYPADTTKTEKDGA